MEQKKNPTHRGGRVYDTGGVCVTLGAGHGMSQPYIMVKEATKQGYAVAEEGDNINLEQPNSNTRRRRVGKGVAQTLMTAPQQAVLAPEPSGIYTETSEAFQRGPILGISRTLKANKSDSGVVINNRIRKLTPLECWRLMGFDDDDFYKAKAAGVSDNQLYKQAGNSIVVDVLEAQFYPFFAAIAEIERKNDDE